MLLRLIRVRLFVESNLTLFYLYTHSFAYADSVPCVRTESVALHHALKRDIKARLKLKLNRQLALAAFTYRRLCAMLIERNVLIWFCLP